MGSTFFLNSKLVHRNKTNILNTYRYILFWSLGENHFNRWTSIVFSENPTYFAVALVAAMWNQISKPHELWGSQETREYDKLEISYFAKSTENYMCYDWNSFIYIHIFILYLIVHHDIWRHIFTPFLQGIQWERYAVPFF